MQRLWFAHRLPAVAAIVLLSGCGLSTGVPAAPSYGTAAKPSTNGALLYVANGSPTSGVDILTFPQGKHIATISGIGAPRGVCADRSGHVWITALLHGQKYALYEFARGGTKPLAMVRRRQFLGLCTVDPGGDVAVMVSFVGSVGAVEIWPPALQAKPNVIEVPLYPASGVYDGQGNLYLTGTGNSDAIFGVLPKGSSKFTYLHLNERGNIDYGALGWDGTYVTLGTYSRGSIVARLTIQGQVAKVTSKVHLRDFTWYMQYVLYGDRIVSQHGDGIALYKYPAGGAPIAVFSGVDKPVQLAISPQLTR